MSATERSLAGLEALLRAQDLRRNLGEQARLLHAATIVSDYLRARGLHEVVPASGPAERVLGAVLMGPPGNLRIVDPQGAAAHGVALLEVAASGPVSVDRQLVALRACGVEAEVIALEPVGSWAADMAATILTTGDRPSVVELPRPSGLRLIHA